MKLKHDIQRKGYTVITYSVTKLVNAPNWGVDRNFIPMSKEELSRLTEMFGGPGFTATAWQELKEGEAHAKIEQGDVVWLVFDPPIHSVATVGRLARAWRNYLSGEWKAREVY